MRFTGFYAGNSVCAPSRAVLLTGISSAYVPIRGNAGYFGKDDWSPTWLESDTFTLGELFKSAGYQSAFIGKWHLDNPDDISTWPTAIALTLQLKSNGLTENLNVIFLKVDSG